MEKLIILFHLIDNRTGRYNDEGDYCNLKINMQSSYVSAKSLRGHIITVTILSKWFFEPFA